jgi:uncharacterized membrane protein YidH (DUF202 family)
MKSEQNYIKDLSDIRQMMEKSTRFMSLTGWSGIMAGIYALAGAFVAYKMFYSGIDGELMNQLSGKPETGFIVRLLLLATVILVLAMGTAIFLSSRRAKRRQETIWNPAARRLVIHLSIPLVAGGLFILILISKGMMGLLAPATLIFYGLALINASKFTFEDVKFLGMAQIALGLLGTWLTGAGLILWAIGFGIMHIVYGIHMQWRYER